MLAIPIVLMGYTLLLTDIVPFDEDSPTGALVMLVLFTPVGIGLLILMLYLMRPDYRAQAQKVARADAITQQVAPDAVPIPVMSPAEETPPGRAMPRRVKYPAMVALMVVIIVGWMGVRYLLDYAGGGVSESLEPVAGFFMGVLFLLIWEGFKWSYTQQEPIPWRRVGKWLVVVVLVLPGIALLLLAIKQYVAWVFDLFGDYPLLAGTVVFLGGLAITLLVVTIIFIMPVLLVQWRVFRALRRLDYDTALRRATWNERWLRSSTMKALVLAYMGRYVEAEAAARHSLRFAKQSLNLVDGIDRGWLLEVLGHALMGLERWEEAEAGFKGAIELSTWDSDRRTSLAEVYLRQEIEPAAAQRWAAEAVNNRFSSFLAALGMRYANAELFANHAWALALAGRHDEAQAELGQALANIDHELPLVRASVCYRAGQVHRLGGDDAVARDYFKQAMTIDPDGSFGAQARAALAALGQV